MEQRKPQITIGAGHEESRVNQEFTDWLKRWSGPILIVITLVSLAYVAKIRWKMHQEDRRDSAFADLVAARDAGDPSNLLRVAQEHRSLSAVRDLATLAAADLHLEAFRRGVRAGAQEDEQTREFKPDDLLSDEAREAELDQAERLYREVLDRSVDDPDAVERAMSAYAGLASVAIGRRDWDEARKTLEAQIALAERRGVGALATVARRRLESFTALQKEPPVLPQDRIAVFIPPAPPEEFPVDPAAVPAPGDASGEGATQFDQPGMRRGATPTDAPTGEASQPTPFEKPKENKGEGETNAPPPSEQPEKKPPDGQAPAQSKPPLD